MSVVVLLNGVGSVGKTSIAKAVQAKAARPTPPYSDRRLR